MYSGSTSCRRSHSRCRTPRFKVAANFTGLLAALICFAGCGIKGAVNDATDAIKDTTNQALSTVDDAVNQLGNESSNWQQILQQTADKLPKDLQSTIGHEVSDTLTRATAAAGSNVLCIHDVVRNRVRQDLLHIRDELVAKLTGAKPPADEREPWLCSVVPAGIDMTLDPNRRNKIEFFGYDFDRAPIQVLLVKNSGTVDVTASLAIQTHYQMTLNLGGNGVQFTPDSQKLVLKWKGKEQSTIPLIYPQTPVCESKTPPSIAVNNITFQPPLTRGDKDFDGNGPRVNVTVKLVKADDGSHVDAQISMTAAETKSDWTTVSGSMTHIVYTPDPGWKVEQIIGETEDNFQYTDSNHTDDYFDRGAGGLVNKYEFVGDTKDDEAGLRTKVTVHFNALRVVLKQTGNCVSSFKMLTLRQQNLLSDKTMQRLGPQLKRLPASLSTLGIAKLSERVGGNCCGK